MTTPNDRSDLPPTAEDMEIVHVEDGPMPSEVWEEADDMIYRLARKSPRPILFARVKIRVDEDRDSEEQTIAQATMDVSGEIIRAQVAAPAPRDALNALHDRMDKRIRKLADKRRDTGRMPPSTPEGTWRSGDLPTARPGFFPRPPEDRRLVRRKSFAPGERISLEEALFDLDVLDHRFFLFTHASDGEISVVYEDDGEVKLRRQSGGEPLADDPLPIEVDPAPAPELETDEAIERLDVTAAPFIFFRDRDSGQGRVIYRRYDGHYGLVEPSTS